MIDKSPSESESIRGLVRRARRRFFFNVAVAQGVAAASVAMAGAILILVMGSQFLDWRWPALVAVVTFPVAFYRTARRVPSPYRVAQIVDERLALSDSLSTALYFSDVPEDRHASESMRQAQLSESERIGRQVDPSVAVPLAAPRTTTYVFGALFLAAAALFALRYGVERKMDLQKPLARILFDAFGVGGFEQRAATQPKRGGKKPWEQTPVGLTLEDHDPAAQGKLDEAPPSVLDTIEDPDVNNDGAQQPGGKSHGKSESSQMQGEKSDEGSEESESAQGSSSSKDADQSGSKQGDPSAGKQSPNASGENSSLASKIKDAMSNLLASMRPQTGGANQQQQQSQNSGQQKQQQQAKSDSKGAAGQGQKKGGEKSADSQEGESSDDDSDSGKSAEGKSSGKSSDQQASHNPGSGIGRQDGAKDAKLAEQLEAMGKISEIIGKRSANVTGEVTVEVNSSSQQIRTQYTDSKATHGEAGGEINRDEVPVALQQYVQDYFEQVRKQPAAPKAAAPATKETK